MRSAANGKLPSATLPEAVCRHFGACGGCALQHLAPDAYRDSKRDQILDALARHGIPDPPQREMVSVPPCSRRRATLKLKKAKGETRIGFHALRSQDLVDIHECHVLTPGLFKLAQGMRGLFDAVLSDSEEAELYMVDADNGFDVALSWKRALTPDLTRRIAAAAPKLGLVRVTAGRELLYLSGAPEIRFAKATVKLPPNAFLQPTREGEAILQARVTEAVGKARKIVDLFSGCGTFALPLAEKAQIHAVDADGPMLTALAAAARSTSGLKPVTTEKRDLFKRPLTPSELKRFDAAVLDPPRMGALTQVKKLSSSRLKSIAYVSCDAASFARDARVLIDGGFRLDWLVGVDQFLWSAHIELAAAFSRD
jgi:23S rRNA (uracil1939-C5)-methyltransferase